MINKSKDALDKIKFIFGEEDGSIACLGTVPEPAIAMVNVQSDDPLVKSLAKLRARRKKDKIKKAKIREDFMNDPDTVFHGTDADEFEKFSSKKIGSATDAGHLGAGHYFSTDRNIGRGNKTLIGAKVTLKNPLHISLPSFSHSKNLVINQHLGTSNLVGHDLTKELKKRGHDGVVLDYSPTGYKHKEIMVMHPKQITTRMAFNKKQPITNESSPQFQIKTYDGMKVKVQPEKKDGKSGFGAWAGTMYVGNFPTSEQAMDMGKMAVNVIIAHDKNQKDHKK